MLVIGTIITGPIAPGLHRLLVPVFSGHVKDFVDYPFDRLPDKFFEMQTPPWAYNLRVSTYVDPQYYTRQAIPINGWAQIGPADDMVISLAPVNFERLLYFDNGNLMQTNPDSVVAEYNIGKTSRYPRSKALFIYPRERASVLKTLGAW